MILLFLCREFITVPSPPGDGGHMPWLIAVTAMAGKMLPLTSTNAFAPHTNNSNVKLFSG